VRPLVSTGCQLFLADFSSSPSYLHLELWWKICPVALHFSTAFPKEPPLLCKRYQQGFQCSSLISQRVANTFQVPLKWSPKSHDTFPNMSRNIWAFTIVAGYLFFIVKIDAAEIFLVHQRLFS
jgi:hypothetical protein